MTLTEVNHVITEARTMLNTLVASAVIDEQDRRILLPVIVEQMIKNESVKI